MKLQYLDRAIAASRAGKPAAIATNLTSGEQSLIEGSEVSGNLKLDGTIQEGVRKALSDDRSMTMESAAGPIFIEVFNPPLRCFIVGAVHIRAPPLRQTRAFRK